MYFFFFFLLQVTKVATISLPEHPRKDYKVTGTCNGTDGQQEMHVDFGSADHPSSIVLQFSRKGENWSVSSFVASLFLDPEVFGNGTIGGKFL